MRAPGEPNHDNASPHARGTAAQKKSLHARERGIGRVQQARAGYRERIVGLDSQHLKVVEGSDVNPAMTHLYGRTPRGERVIGAVPQHYGQEVTMLGPLGGRASKPS